MKTVTCKNKTCKTYHTEEVEFFIKRTNCWLREKNLKLTNKFWRSFFFKWSIEKVFNQNCYVNVGQSRRIFCSVPTNRHY